MLRIRLQNPQKLCGKHIADIVVLDSRKKRDSRPIACIGNYTVLNDKKRILNINRNMLCVYLYKGAQPSKTVIKIIRPLLNCLQ